MNRQGRLAHARAKNWVRENKGAKSLVRRYQRYFGVDLVAAAIELRMLGVHIDDERTAQLQKTATESSRRATGRRAAAKKQDAAALAEELDRCWPVWAEEPFPFPVDKWEITDVSSHNAGPVPDTKRPADRTRIVVDRDEIIPF